MHLHSEVKTPVEQIDIRISLQKLSVELGGEGVGTGGPVTTLVDGRNTLVDGRNTLDGSGERLVCSTEMSLECK